MTALPVIVGFGGVGPAGRSSFHHAYRRIIFDHLSPAQQVQTTQSLAAMMKLAYVRDGEWRSADGRFLDASAQAQLPQAGTRRYADSAARIRAF